MKVVITWKVKSRSLQIHEHPFESWRTDYKNTNRLCQFLRDFDGFTDVGEQRF